MIGGAASAIAVCVYGGVSQQVSGRLMGGRKETVTGTGERVRKGVVGGSKRLRDRRKKETKSGNGIACSRLGPHSFLIIEKIAG